MCVVVVLVVVAAAAALCAAAAALVVAVVAVVVVAVCVVAVVAVVVSVVAGVVAIVVGTVVVCVPLFLKKRQVPSFLIKNKNQPNICLKCYAKVINILDGTAIPPQNLQPPHRWMPRPCQHYPTSLTTAKSPSPDIAAIHVLEAYKHSRF